ncbi:teichoic acid transport system permease protein [Breznakia sp. PF5-3]|uniref:ABC transporter permease n=1 Tax=unclassified Breznakia TaxID=2623764 RepID=UPI002405080C|nr:MULTISPECIES: ABC transporter permease [unclassified Breznakia]MDF9824848.1 teichoic acid transport system permease protein [Breznakia sp. PM6-1]MDF9835705.1 teichoic acid transport system permease protein [Breznakia sp. PF5-3]MDF9838265.1 teichoic acid transport system permease protein [Breznakia sp. PFB2-8]MDF9860296.1 teichoic acid transport system permease protein [Breznakia sp. PH5-24]
MKSVFFVLKENITNLYRIFSIAKYELLADMRDSKLGIFWNIANPLIQMATFWFVFGIGIRKGRGVGIVSFLPWMIVGITVWFFISPCITKGVSCIYEKRNIITKMKFPVSILPATIVLKELFNHIIMITLVITILFVRGHQPNLMWFQILYYMFCAICFSISLGMITSVLNMFTRDVKKLVTACMRMLMYLTPILWTMENIPEKYQIIMKMNPLYYIVEGYRGSLFFQDSFMNHPAQTAFFWGLIIVMFVIGSNLMYRFKHKFIDML